MNELLTIEEVAEILNVSTQTVRKLINTTKLPVIKISRRCYRIQKQDLNKYIIETSRTLIK